MSLSSCLQKLGKKKLAIISVIAAIVVVGSVVTTILLTGKKQPPVFPVDNVAGTDSGQIRTKIDSPVLEEETRKSFDFFWKNANTDKNSKGYGLVNDRETNKDMASIASVGYALASYGIGAERGYVSKNDAQERTIGTLNTLLKNVEGEQGFLYHFVDKNTGKRFGNCEVSIIDTSICLNGVLFAGEYFGGEVKEKAAEFYGKINWPWYFNNDTKRFYMSYTPENGKTGEWNVAAEQFMVYFLSAGSPTHPVAGTAFDNFARDGYTWPGYPAIIDAPARALFTRQYSETWYDMSNMVDRDNFDWYRNSRIAALVNRQFSVDNMNLFKTFGRDSWGLTACDGPRGYSGSYGASPTAINDGTVAPSAAAGSVPLAPRQTIKALEKFKTIDGLVGDYGFKDSFNLEGNTPWIDQDVIGIDKGISLLMIENYRSGLIWKTMEKNKYVAFGMKASGFTPADTVMVDDADGNTAHDSWITNGAYTVKPTDDAALGLKAMEITFDKTGKKDAVLTANITADKVDAQSAGVLKMMVKGSGSVSATLTSRSDANIGTTNAVTFNSPDTYKALYFDLTQFKDTITTLKSISLNFDPGAESKGTVKVDEIQIASAVPQARAIVIDDRPYVGSNVFAEFDFYDAMGREEGPCQYQWLASDDANGTFTPLQGATSSLLNVTKDAVNKYLKLEIIPSTKDGVKGNPCYSNVSSRVTEERPIAAADIQEQIKQSMGMTPDDISGDTFDLLPKLQDGGDKVFTVNYADGESKIDYKKENTPWSFLKRDITVHDISKFSSLAMSFKGDGGYVVVKFESPSGAIGEVKLKVNKNDYTLYEWDLSTIRSQLTNVSRILVFPAPGMEGVEGTVYCNKLCMSVARAKTNVIQAGQTSNELNATLNEYKGDKKDFSFNNGWIDGADDVYTPTKNDDGTWKVDYDKDNKPEWAFMKSSIKGRFSDFKKITLTIQGTKGTHILYKIESPDLSNPKVKWFKESDKFTLTGGVDTIEINIANCPSAQLDKAESIVLFAEGGKSTGSGTFTIMSGYFSTQASTIVQKVTKYNGDKKDFHCNQYWYDVGKDDVYTVTYEGSTAIVNYTKAKGQEWAVLGSPISGRFSDFNYVTLKIKGEAGKTAMIKLQSSTKATILEQKVTFDGTLQTFIIDFSSKHNMNAALDSMTDLLIFAEPGKAGVSGKFEIHDAFFSVNPPSEGEIITVKTNKYSGDKKDFHINSYWQDNGDGVYKITNNASVNTVTYNKGTFEYPFIKIPVEGRFSDFNYLTFKLKAAKGTRLLFKLEKNGLVKEYFETADGTDQIIVLDMTSLHVSYDSCLNSLDSVLIFAEPGKTDVSGTITFNDVVFSAKPPEGTVVVNKVNKYSGDKQDFHINSYWQDNGDGVYTITNNGSVNTVAYNKGKLEYPFVKIPVEGRFSDFNYLTFKFKAPKDTRLLFKLEKNGLVKEYMETADGTDQTIVLDLTSLHASYDDNLNKLDTIMVFAEPGKVNVTGTITFNDVVFSVKPPEGTVVVNKVNKYSGDKQDFHINSFWQDNGDGAYTIENNNSVNTVAYKKGNLEYPFVKIPVEGRFSDFNYLSFKLKAPVGTKFLFKLEKNDLVKEYMETADGTDQTITLDMTSLHTSYDDNLNKLDNVLVFIEPGKVNLSGTVTFNDAVFSVKPPEGTVIENKVNTYSGDKKDFAINKFWKDNGDGCYKISTSGDVNTVTYDKKDLTYPTVQIPVTGKFSDFNYLVFNINGAASQPVMFKLNKNGLNLEQKLVLDGTNQTYVIDLRTAKATNSADLDKLDTVLIFAWPGEGQKTGGFTVSNAYFTLNNPVTENVYTGDKSDFLFNNFWKETSGAGAYKITQNGTTNVVEYSTQGKINTGIQSPVKGRLSDFGFVSLNVKGDAGKKLTLKLQNGSKVLASKEFTLDGTLQRLTLDYSALKTDSAVFDAMNQVSVVMNDGASSSGKVEIHDAWFSVNDPGVNTYAGGGNDFKFNNFWGAGNPSEGVYTISAQNGVTNVAYAKKANFEWSFMQVPLKGNFSDFGYIVFKIQGEKGQTLKFKLESGLNKEFDFTLDGTEQTFVMDIREFAKSNPAALNALNRIIVFAAPGSASDSGSFAIKDASFTNINPNDKNVYAGGKQDFSIMDFWRDNGDKVYTIDSSNGINAVTFAKKAGNEWSTAAIPVSGKFSDFDYIVFKVKGTAGEKALLKLNGFNLEQWITFTGNEQTVVFDIRSLHASSNAQLDTLDKVLIFAAPGDIKSGSFTVSNACFTNNNPNTINTYDGSKKDFAVNDFWRDNGDKVYTIQTEKGVNTVSYAKKAGTEWSTLAIPVSGKLSDFDYIVFNVKGTKDEKVLFKLNILNKELWHTFTGTDETVVFDMRQFDHAQLDQLDKILIFGAPGDVKEGSFIIANTYFTNVNPNAINIYDGSKKDFAVNDFWRDNGDKVYTIDYSNGMNTVKYDKKAGSEWSTLAIPVSGKLSDFNYLTFVISGTKDEKVLFKLQQGGLNKEFWHTFTGTTEIVTLDLASLHPGSDADLAALTKILIFGNPGNTGAGQFIVNNAFFSVAAPNIYLGGKEDFHFNSGWYDADGGKFDIAKQENGSYQITANHSSWSTLRTNISGKFSDFDSIKIKVKGTANKKILLKMQNDPFAKEAWFTLDGSEQTFTLDFSDKKPGSNAQLDTLKNLMIFYDPENSGNVAGEKFTISDIWFTKSAQ